MSLEARESIRTPSVDSVPKSLSSRIVKRRGENNFRELELLEDSLIDFCSNDYLGLSRTGLLKGKIAEINSEGRFDGNEIGSTGSRLISGNSKFAEDLERLIALYHNSEAALIFPSGYQANLGLISTLPTRHDTIIYDEASHASIIDGARLSYAKRRMHFAHNDCEDLRRKLCKATGDIYVIVESIYSMDGDFAPLDDLVATCSEFGAQLIVDEAHAVGIFGPGGRGRVNEMGLERSVFARVITFGKALGAHGAAVLCAKETSEFLVNFSRPFIYSTSLDFESLKSIRAAYALLESKAADPVSLFLLINEFRQTGSKLFGDCLLDSYSPIQGIILPSNDLVRSAAQNLTRKNFAVKAICAPTVPAGKERIRICLHTFNSSPEVQGLLFELSEILSGRAPK